MVKGHLPCSPAGLVREASARQINGGGLFGGDSSIGGKIHTGETLFIGKIPSTRRGCRDKLALDQKSEQTRLDRDRSKRGKKIFSCAKNWDSGFGSPGTRRLRLGLPG
jgi:hypothetical protein